MIAAINDLSFQYQMSSLEEAIDCLKKFLDLCKEIEKGHMTNVEKIVIARNYEYVSPLAPNLVLQQVIKRITPRDDQRRLMSLLTRRDTMPEQTDIVPFCLDGKESVLCAQAKNDMLISLLSNPIFETAVLTGTCGNISTTIRNLSQMEHIEVHKEPLGIRRYHANAIKHKADRINMYGKGRQASPMDLDDLAAQQLLNRAIWIGHRLYAKKNGKVYAFMAESPCVYHGYIDDAAPEPVQRELSKVEWD